MFNITETNTWPASVRGYGTTDSVLGGNNADLGESNLPLKDLTDRTKYLYDRLGRREDVVVITSSVTIGVASKFKENYISASGNLTIIIDDVTTFPTGAILPFKIKCPTNKAVTFQTTSSQLIEDGNIAASKIYGCDGEDFELIAAGSFWIFRSGKGNWDKVGQDDLCRFQPRNSIIANGCTPENGSPLLLRADLPRLADKVLATAIDDSTWLSNINYRCFWSKGNGTSTMRPPDMRGMFLRSVDLGRGVRIGQLDNTPGSYEADDVKQPANGVKGIKRTGVGTIAQAVDNNTSGDDQFDLTKTFDIFTGLETRPKNVGLIPIIYY